MVLSVWSSLAHTLLASHAFNGSMRRLPHAQVALAPRPPHEARWARIVLSAECTAWLTPGSPLTLSRSLCTDGLTLWRDGRRGYAALSAAWLTALLASLTLSSLLCTDGLTLWVVAADDIRGLGRPAIPHAVARWVPMTDRFGPAGLGPCSPLALYGWLFTGCLTLWSEECR